jgi:3-methyladenine DNA glycosylase AlkD
MKNLSYARILKALRRHANPRKAQTYRGFFKNAQKDVFLGVTAPLVEKVAKNHWEIPFPHIRRLMASRVHDERSLANSILVLKFSKGGPVEREKVFKFYLKNRGLIRNWDGVDDSAPYIVGPHLLDKDRKILFQLVRSKNLWDRRISIVSTWWFIRQGDTKDTFKLAKLLLKDEEDLIHKAAGWMLREAGKRNLPGLKQFLKGHRAAMPRTMLRYAIEKFPEAQRQRYLGKK